MSQAYVGEMAEKILCICRINFRRSMSYHIIMFYDAISWHAKIAYEYVDSLPPAKKI